MATTNERRFEAGWETAVGDFATAGRTFEVSADDSAPWRSGYRLAAARIAYLLPRRPAWMVLADLRGVAS